ncbi:MAG: hypothetical protein IJX24_03915 [Oscillospiraceae bacterium]|nr:hypothetical protein [Oscillospiraceae bacterium]
MDEEIMTTQKEKENADNQEYIVAEDELIEEVREKHEKKKKPKCIADIFTMQLILTVLIVLVFAVINIFDSSVTQWFIKEFKERSGGETEKIIKDAVNYAVNIIR